MMASCHVQESWGECIGSAARILQATTAPEAVATPKTLVAVRGPGPSDPRLKDAMELTRFAMAAVREGDRARALAFLRNAAQAIL